MPEDEKASFIGKMHSPEMQDKIKSTFTSEAFQDHIDKMEAEQGMERQGSWHRVRVPSTLDSTRIVFMRVLVFHSISFVRSARE